jgi:PTS system nitrogen regulatory IIA component
MNDLSDLLRPEAVSTGVAAPTRKAVLAAVAGAAATAGVGEARDLGERLAAREKLGSTGFGNGVAIPHARVPGLGAVTGVFLRLSQPIDFGAVDDLPVDLVFALLSPVDAGADHLKALARVSRRLRDRPLLAKLRGAASRDALYALLCEDQARDAA